MSCSKTLTCLGWGQVIRHPLIWAQVFWWPVSWQDLEGCCLGWNCKWYTLATANGYSYSPPLSWYAPKPSISFQKAKRKPKKRQESSYVSYLDSRYDTYELHSVCNKFRSHCHCHQPMNCWAIWAKQGNFYAQKVAFVKESTCWPTKYF